MSLPIIVVIQNLMQIFILLHDVVSFYFQTFLFQSSIPKLKYIERNRRYLISNLQYFIFESSNQETVHKIIEQSPSASRKLASTLAIINKGLFLFAKIFRFVPGFFHLFNSLCGLDHFYRIFELKTINTFGPGTIWCESFDPVVNH